MYFLAEPRQEIAQKISEEIIEIKRSLGKHINLKNYPKETVSIGQNLDEVRGLHMYADCLVDVSHGGPTSPIMGEARIIGKPIISHHNIYVYDVPIFNSSNYDCDSKWGRPDFYGLRLAMSYYYRNRICEPDVNYEVKQYRLEHVLRRFKDVVQ
jgi:hypothetical protein